MRARTILLIGLAAAAIGLAEWKHARVRESPLDPPVRVTSPVSGAVSALYVGVGAGVKAGQALVFIDSPALRARLEAAKADLEMERSAEVNAENAAQLIDAESDQLVLSRVQLAQSDVQRCEQAVAAAEIAARQQWIVSPVDGKVTSVKAQIGQSLAPGPKSPVLLEIAPKGAM